MKVAIIRDGVVDNVIVPPEGDYTAPEGSELVECEDDVVVGPGFTYDGQGFAAPVIVASVPESVTPLQMRKALRQLGLKATVDAYIATLDEETVEEWEYALAIERGNATLQAAAIGLGMTEEQADDLLRLAASM